MKQEAERTRSATGLPALRMAEDVDSVHSHRKPMTSPKPESAPLTVWLVEDYAPFRNTVSRLLNGTEGMACTHIFATAEDALRSLKTQSTPRAILVDVGLPGMNGIEFLTKVRETAPDTRVIILTAFEDEDKVFRAICAGAAGYLLKHSGKVELALAISAVIEGQQYLSPTVATHVADYMRRVQNPADSLQPIEQLTPRQREILRLIAEGHTTQEIAQALMISVKTVETHRAQLMQRLGIFDIAGLVRYALRTGVIVDSN